MALRVASSFMRPFARTRERLAMFTAAIEHNEDDAAPEHLERRAHVANDVGLEGQERRAVAGIHEHGLERPARSMSRAFCASTRAWARASVTPGASRNQSSWFWLWRALSASSLRLEGERHEDPHLRAEEGERLGQHADDVVDLAVQAEAAPDDAVDACWLPCGEGVAQHATLFLPGVPSASAKSRPREGWAPSTWKNDGVTFMAETPSAWVPSPTR